MIFKVGDYMIKKIGILFVMLLFLSSNVLAYDYQDFSNKTSVESAISSIYSLKRMYDEMSGIDDNDDEVIYEVANNDSYWWPIGSVETTESDGKLYALGEPEASTITSSFGYRGAVINSSGVRIAGNENHGAIDIATGSGAGNTNVIAAKSGVVVYPTDIANINCRNADPSCTGYGNYVIIQHSDGNYTLYAHLHAGTISVKAGDSVKQGQVIAKMGNSGNSTGPHLHFEIRLGENSSSARVDPLTYIDKDNPRPASSKGDASLDSLLDYINQFEGVGCSGQQSEEGDNYIACLGGDGVTTIGHGVVWESNKGRFQARGINDVSAGTRVAKSVVDDIQLELLTELHDSVVNALSRAGIDGLKDYQINALTSQAYNGGFTVVENSSYGYDFITNWKKYDGHYSFDDIYNHKGSLWYDSLCRPYGPGSAFEGGLKRRRVSEWMMFNDGTMDHLESGFDASKYAWPE